MHRLLGKLDLSINILIKLDSFAKTKNIGDALNRFIKVRLMVEELAGDQAMEWRTYFAGYRSSIPDKKPSLSENWIFVYLKIRRGNEIPFAKFQLLSLVMQPLPIDSNVPDYFIREYYRMLGNRLMGLEEYNTAAVAF